MSAWLAATRALYRAGGQALVRDLSVEPEALRRARKQGVIAPGDKGGHWKTHFAVLTPLGQALCEGRVEMVVPYTPASNGGRAPGTHRRPRATWLAALPRSNEVRLTGAVHRAQNDGSCYW